MRYSQIFADSRKTKYTRTPRKIVREFFQVGEAYPTANVCLYVLCNCHIHRRHTNPEATSAASQKHVSPGWVYYCWIGPGSEVLIAVIAWSRTRGLG